MEDEPRQTSPRTSATEEPQEGFGRRYQPRLYLRLLVIGLVAAYAIAFVLENDKQVHVHFVLGTARLSQIWLILLSVGIGLVLGVLVSQLYRRRRRRRD
ncbi:MAG TPA: LapA family protein [Gaiellaceae bacterium]|nr:LapA family protein [Gaiellaceae bacterium]